MDTSVFTGVPDVLHDVLHIIIFLFFVESAKEKMENPVGVLNGVFDADGDAMAFSRVLERFQGKPTSSRAYSTSLPTHNVFTPDPTFLHEFRRGIIRLISRLQRPGRRPLRRRRR